MKAKELISILQDAVNKHGDMAVFCNSGMVKEVCLDTAEDSDNIVFHILDIISYEQSK